MSHVHCTCSLCAQIKEQGQTRYMGGETNSCTHRGWGGGTICAASLCVHVVVSCHTARTSGCGFTVVGSQYIYVVPFLTVFCVGTQSTRAVPSCHLTCVLHGADRGDGGSAGRECSAKRRSGESQKESYSLGDPPRK